MSMFQCQHCGCAENTALTSGYLVFLHNRIDFTGVESRKGKKLCSACTPAKFKDGAMLGMAGKWHGKFPQVFLKPGMYFTDADGNLAHRVTGCTNYHEH